MSFAWHRQAPGKRMSRCWHTDVREHTKNARQSAQKKKAGDMVHEKLLKQESVRSMHW